MPSNSVASATVTIRDGHLQILDATRIRPKGYALDDMSLAADIFRDNPDSHIVLVLHGDNLARLNAYLVSTGHVAGKDA